VLPAPSSPVRRTTSPARSRSPRCIPARSVSAAELETSSGKVVVTGAPEPDRRVACVDDLDDTIVGEGAHHLETCPAHQLLRSNADELGLLAAGQGVLHGGACRPRHVLPP